MTLRTIEEHLGAILATVRPTAVTGLGLREALGCTLAEPVRAAVDLPGFTNSAMDGYAVLAADCAGASPSAPVQLPVAGDIRAGETRPLTLEPGSCWRIMTGAPMPAGADAVVPVEDADGGVEQVSLTVAPAVGRHVRQRGEDVAAGTEILEAGAVLTPGRLALVAAANVPVVRAHTPARVAIISTGDELRQPGASLEPGQIVDSNSLMLAALVRSCGLEVIRLPRSRDDADSLRRALTEAAAAADLVLTTGGVSMGAYDTVKEVLTSSGEGSFAKVAMRPGMPQGHGVIGVGRTPIITLPGNPLSAMVSFHVYVLPVLAALQGRQVDAHSWRSAAVPGRAASGWRSVPGKTEFTRVVLRGGIATPATGQGSHMVGALADANALAIVPPEVSQVTEGDVLSCLRIVGSVPANAATTEGYSL